MKDIFPAAGGRDVTAQEPKNFNRLTSSCRLINLITETILSVTKLANTFEVFTEVTKSAQTHKTKLMSTCTCTWLSEMSSLCFWAHVLYIYIYILIIIFVIYIFQNDKLYTF